MKVYVIVSAAIPTKRGLNALGVKVMKAYVDKDKAEAEANAIRSNKDRIVQGIECEIHTSVVETDLIE